MSEGPRIGEIVDRDQLDVRPTRFAQAAQNATADAAEAVDRNVYGLAHDSQLFALTCSECRRSRFPVPPCKPSTYYAQTDIRIVNPWMALTNLPRRDAHALQPIRQRID